MVFATQPPAVTGGEIQAVVTRVRRLGLERLQRQLAIAFDDDPDSPTIIRLARFALAAIDGAFVASQADPEATLTDVLGPLPGALVAAYHAS